MRRAWSIPLGIAVVVVVIACICLLAGVVAWSFFTLVTPVDSVSFTSQPDLPTPVIIRPTSAVSSAAVPTETLNVLAETVIPASNLIELAERLEGKQDISPVLEPPAAPLEVGSRQTFWVLNTETDESFQISATLRYITSHGYFWIQDGVDYRTGDLQALAETFENKIYPTNRDFFGSEWTPGVDGDPHLYILYAQGIGDNVAGYFSPGDEVPPQASEYSNGHEMFVFNADTTALDREYTYSTLAHEFQHMIHWYRDVNEDLWLNEGFSELAMFLNGYSTAGVDTIYISDPDIQFTYWPGGSGSRAANYGAAFLFLTYFLDRFGEQATQALVAEPTNGLSSVDIVLDQIGAQDPGTDQPIGADEFFADWVIANYLRDERVGDGQYTYHNYPAAPQASETEMIRACPAESQTRDVSQYGVDYIRVSCRGDYTLHFEGTIQVAVLPSEPHSGQYAFWSNRGDVSNMTLTRSFDFSGHEGPLTLTYWTWYDLEEDYDYLYLEASLDGEDWQILKTPSGTSEDPNGNSYGWGYTGLSGEGTGEASRWIQESVDLTQFAGQEVQLRFEYVTDAGVNLEGFLLDDVEIPQVGYTEDFEAGDGGWVPDGFARIQNVLPQTFQVALISHGRDTTVRMLSLSADNTVDIPLALGDEVDEITLVVAGTSRFTRQKAGYRFSIQP